MAGIVCRSGEPCHDMRSSRAFITGVIILTMAMPRICTAASITLAPVFDSNDLLEYCLDGSPNAFELTANSDFYADNNVGPVRTIDDAHQPPNVFSSSSAYAVITTSNWAEMGYRGWWINYGEGRHDSYVGNDDAAQLWIDFHSGQPKRETYEPTAKRVRVAAGWYGAGREIPFRAGDITGTVGLQVRSIDAHNYLGMSVTGDVSSDGTFSGMMRAVTSDRHDWQRIRGDGWALDGRLRFRYHDDFVGQVTVEGIMGRVAYKQLEVEDSLIVSPRTFTDPEGFVHDIGGVTGTIWYEDRAFDINPLCRVDAVWMRKPWVLMGVEWQDGYQTTPSFGFAWPQKMRWLPFVQYYPTQRRFELGAIGSGWQIGVAGDDWLLASPKSTEICVSLRALRF